MLRNELDSKLSYVWWFLCGLQRGRIRKSRSLPFQVIPVFRISIYRVQVHLFSRRREEVGGFYWFFLEAVFDFVNKPKTPAPLAGHTWLQEVGGGVVGAGTAAQLPLRAEPVGTGDPEVPPFQAAWSLKAAGPQRASPSIPTMAAKTLPLEYCRPDRKGLQTASFASTVTQPGPLASVLRSLELLFTLDNSEKSHGSLGSPLWALTGSRFVPPLPGSRNLTSIFVLRTQLSTRVVLPAGLWGSGGCRAGPWPSYSTVPAPSTRNAFISTQIPPGVALARSLVEQRFLPPF